MRVETSYDEMKCKTYDKSIAGISNQPVLLHTENYQGWTVTLALLVSRRESYVIK